MSVPGILSVPLMRPRFRPPPSVRGSMAALMMLVPRPPATPVLKLVPPKTDWPLPTLRADCHCTPNSLAMPVDTSTMSASTKTCARRGSSLSITARRLR